MKNKEFETIEIPVDKIKEYIDIPENELKLIDSVSIKVENINKKEKNISNTITIPVYDIKKELEKFKFEKNDTVTIPITEEKENEVQQTITIPVEEIKKELEKADNNLQDTITISVDDIKNKLNEIKGILKANQDTEDEEIDIYDNTQPLKIIEEEKEKDNKEEIEIYDNTQPIKIIDDTNEEEIVENKIDMKLASNDEEIEKTINIPLEKIKTEIIEKEKFEETITIPIEDIKLNLKEETKKDLTETIEIPKDLIIESVKNEVKKEKKKYFSINNKIICKKIWLVLFIISTVAAISLIYNIFIWKKQDDTKDMKKLQTNTQINESNNKQENSNKDNNDNNKSDSKDNENNKEEVQVKDDGISFMDVDLKESIKANEDTIGWIKINNTEVNHPFVQRDNNDYYQSHSFYLTSSSGWLYLNKDNDFENFDRNNILYTELHKKSAQFSSLKNMVTPEWYQNEENKYIKISGLNKNSVWEIFSVYTTNKKDYEKIKFETENEFTEYYKTGLINSFNNFNVEVNQNDKLLTIVTYFDKDLKLVAHAKLLKTEEKESN